MVVRQVELHYTGSWHLLHLLVVRRSHQPFLRKTKYQLKLCRVTIPPVHVLTTDTYLANVQTCHNKLKLFAIAQSMKTTRRFLIPRHRNANWKWVDLLIGYFYDILIPKFLYSSPRTCHISIRRWYRSRKLTKIFVCSHACIKSNIRLCGNSRKEGKGFEDFLIWTAKNHFLDSHPEP